MNFAIYHGNDRGSRYKEVVAKYLPNDWNIYLFGPELSKTKFRDLEDKKNIIIYNIYSDPIFRKKLSENDVREVEYWLGFPFDLIFDFCIATKDSIKKGNLKTKRETLAKYVIAWRGFLKNNEIELLCTDLSANLIDTVSLLTAKKMHIKMLNLIGGRVEKTLALFDDDFLPSQEFVDNSRAPLDLFSKPPKKVLQITKKHNKPIALPFSLIRSFINYSISYSKRNNDDRIRFATPIELAHREGLGIIRKKIVRFFFDKIKNEDKYFLFPIHWTADAQILWREHSIDQFDLIEKISRALPSDVLLYVRAHPHFMCEDIPIGRILEMKKLKNVRFTSPENDIYKTMTRSLGIITINSTSGFEAIMHGLPVITFGHDFYAKKDIAIVVREVQELPQIFFNVIKNPRYGIDATKRKEFVKEYLNKFIPVRGKFTLEGLEELDEDDAKYVAEKMAEVAEKIRKKS